MKKLALLGVLFCQLFIVSCHKNQADEINGDMTPIEFKSSNLTFTDRGNSGYFTNISADGGEYMMETTNYPSWYIYPICEKKDGDSKTINFEGVTHEYESDWYNLRIPSNKPTNLNISIESNSSKNSRELKIGITNGAYFISLTIIQAGKEIL